ncbi:hypothetical protein PPRY_a1819 [Pseudoalteromonas prydzensis ACAM 620]|nr:hypothetical protein [Pseudoalteromonas prydzensis ACAM 620]
MCIGGVYFLWFKGVGVGFGGTTETWSHFGSFFGGVLSPVLSFFSFLGIIYTVYLQSKSNKEQALANKYTVTAIKLSEEMSKENLVEQRKQFKQQNEYDQQKRLFDMLLNSINRLEIAGENAVLDLTTKVDDDESLSTLGPYYNTYNWRAKTFVIALDKLTSQLNKEGAEIIILYLQKLSGQLHNFSGALRSKKVVFTNPTADITSAVHELESYKDKINESIEVLKSNHAI